MLEVKKLTGKVGAEVLGVDRDRLVNDPDLPHDVLEALEENGALVFRGLHIDDEAQIAFCNRLGTVEKLGNGPTPEIFRVTLDPKKNPAAAYLKGTFDWHIDGMTDDIPIMATVLSAHAVAETGGETEFSSAYAAYDDLSDEEKAEFEQMRVVHTFEAANRVANNDPTPEQLAQWRARPSKTHPLVWTHASGRKSLVLGATTDHIVGWSQEESRTWLDALLRRVTKPERIYRHEWTVGDMVIWDNRGVLHRAAPYDPTSPRDMHRCTLRGDEAVA